MYLLSVILPVYNAAPWLDECLKSLLSSAKAEFERIQLLLIDDGSTDGSGELCDRFAASHPNAVVFHKENGGVASARNVGLDHADGRYIAWVDPDDLVEETWFPSLRDVIEREAPDVIVMDTVCFGTEKEETKVYGRSGGALPRDLFYEDVMRDIRICGGFPDKVMRAELFRKARFDVSLPILEDYALMPKVLSAVETVYYLPHCLYRYRQHESSLLHQVSAERAFLSVRVALQRWQQAEPRFQKAAVTAVALQAFRFCRRAATDPDFGSSKEQVRFCTRYLRKHLWILWRDPALTSAEKGKFFLLAFGLYGGLRRLFTGAQRKTGQ